MVEDMATDTWLWDRSILPMTVIFFDAAIFWR